jgi:hypothetical protein
MGNCRTLAADMLANIAHFPKTLTGQIRPLLLPNQNGLGDDP